MAGLGFIRVPHNFMDYGFFVGRYFESWPQKNMVAFKTFRAKSFRLRKQEQAASLLGILGSVSS